MIDKKEIRVGNLLYSGNKHHEAKTCEVKEILENNFLHWSVDAHGDDYVAQSYYDKSTGIELSGDILKRLGFKKVDGSWVNGQIEIGDGFVVWFSRDSDDYFQAIKTVQHVHQLQNLYYSLTGEELELKEGFSADKD